MKPLWKSIWWRPTIGLFLVCAFVAVNGQAQPGSGTRYEKYVGKYPSELLRREPALKARLRTLLGKSYKTFTDRLQVETPIERDGDAIVIRGCMAHQCTIEEAILVIDLTDGKPYVALRMNRAFSKTFPGIRSKLPDALKRAMEQ